MARATAAQMLILYGGVYPPNHDATTFGNIATHADALIDAYCLPSTLSTTSTTALGIANRIAVELVHHSVWLAGGGDLSGTTHPTIFGHHKNSMTQLLDKILAAASTYGGVVAIVDTVDED